MAASRFFFTDKRRSQAIRNPFWKFSNEFQIDCICYPRVTRMDKLRMLRYWLGLLLMSTLLCLPADAQDKDRDLFLKKGKDMGNDANLANIYSVRKDYFLRYPHAEMAEQMRGRIPDKTKEVRGSTYTLPSWDLKLEIPPGPLVSKETDKPHSPDPYIPVRPQYRPLYAYCGSPGAFDPPPGPGVIGNFVPNHSKIAKGEGGAIIIAPKMAPTCYVQPLLIHDNAPNQAQEGDQSIFEYELTTFGVGPISDTQFQMIDREDNQRFLELFFDPERWLWAARAAGIMQQQQMSTNLANTADWETNTAMETVAESLINVANEESATPVHGSPAHKSKAQAIYMVQQMYKQVFLPMAILLLLPGAIMTQMKGMVQFGVLRTGDEDSQSPFSGIIRSVIAIFLIPATQLIVSYMIDVGNSMAYQVKQWVDFDLILGYAHEQQYGPQRDMTLNCLTEHLKPDQEESRTDPTTQIEGSSIAEGEEELGKAYNGLERKAVEEKSPQISKQMQMCYNFFNCASSFGLIVLCIFQLAMMCYLFLLGPIAAAFYAWPNMKGTGAEGLFAKVFSNWLEGVIVLSLWRFWWNVVLACMTTYIQWHKDLQWFDPSSSWEMMIYTSFQVLLMIVPFQPFKFDAAPAIEKIQSIAADRAGEGGGAAGGAGGDKVKGGGGGGGSGSSGSGGASSSNSSETVSSSSMSVSGTSSEPGQSAGSGSTSGTSGPDSSSGSESKSAPPMSHSQSKDSSNGSSSRSEAPPAPRNDQPPPAAPPSPPPPRSS